jgi:hypothetical protein
MIFRELRAETGRTLSLLHALRFLLATNPAALTQVLGVVYRTMARHLIRKAGRHHCPEQIGKAVVKADWGILPANCRRLGAGAGAGDKFALGPGSAYKSPARTPA